MCNSSVHRPFNVNGVVDPFSFSTFHFLRTCNRLILPTDLKHYYGIPNDNRPFESIKSNPRDIPLHQKPEVNCPEITAIFQGPCSNELSPTRPQLSSLSTVSPVSVDYTPEYPLGTHNRLGNLNYTNLLNRRQRGEKRPIPDEQKDDKYYERRKRNNEAAKKSRDARKLREDRIAFRAALLEQENAILRAQIVALREEMATLRQMIGTRPAQISVNL